MKPNEHEMLMKECIDKEMEFGMGNAKCG